MGKIAGAENADAHQQTAERRRERLEADEKRSLRAGGDGSFSHEQPEGCDGD